MRFLLMKAISDVCSDTSIRLTVALHTSDFVFVSHAPVGTQFLTCMCKGSQNTEDLPKFSHLRHIKSFVYSVPARH